MADVVNLKVETRSDRGKRPAKRARLAGKIPAILYGHKKENLSLYVVTDEFALALRHGSHLVELSGAVSEHAMVRALQWDTFGREVLHIDFIRVTRGEKICVMVPVELRGDAEGLKEGGVIRQLMRTIEVECAVEKTPEKVVVRIADLKLNESLRISDIPAPEGIAFVGDPEDMIVECAIPVEAGETASESSDGTEPEVIGRKKADEDAG